MTTADATWPIRHQQSREIADDVRRHERLARRLDLYSDFHWLGPALLQGAVEQA